MFIGATVILIHEAFSAVFLLRSELKM